MWRWLHCVVYMHWLIVFLFLLVRSPLKTALERQKQAYKAGWLTSPNTYKRQELEEIGTTNPKKYTKVCETDLLLLLDVYNRKDRLGNRVIQTKNPCDSRLE